MNSNIQNLLHQGMALAEQKAYDEASNCFKTILEHDPNRIDALVNLGLMYYYSKKFDLASKTILAVSKKIPESPDINFYLGLINTALKKIPDAISCYKKTVILDPNYVTAWYNLGELMFNQKRYDNAIQFFQKTISIDKNFKDAHLNLGESYSRIGRFKKAIQCFEQVISIQRDHVAAHYNMGVAYNKLRNYKKAIESYNNALAIDSNHVKSHYNKSFILLLLGDFVNGFIEYEWRLQKQETYKSSSKKPFWHGDEEPDKSLLVYAEQGFGDCIQFIRFLPIIQKRVKKIIFECQPELFRLFKGLTGIDVITKRGQPLPPHDLQVSLLSLGYILSLNLEDLPGQFPYLNPTIPLRSKLNNSIEKNKQLLNVGIVWGGTGNTALKADLGRSLFLKEFESLFDIEDIQFFSFQKGPRIHELKEKAGEKLVDLGQYCSDFADTAIAASKMDLIMTVDTAMAHLVGALGLNVWTLLGFDADWRWLQKTDKSPWYPCMKLFRQNEPGNWKKVIEIIKIKLIENLKKIKLNEKNIKTTYKPVKLEDTLLKQKVESYFQKADQYFQKNNLTNTKEKILHPTQTNPLKPNYWNFKGEEAAKQGFIQLSINCLKKACNLSPENGLFYFNLANAYRQGKFYEKSIENYKKALNYV